MSSPDDSGEDHGKPRSIPITRLHMPIVMVVALIAFAVSIGGTVWSVVAHAHATTIHLNENEVIKGGGVAFKSDVQAVERALDQRLNEQHRRMRKLLRELTLRCKSARGELACAVVVPEEE